VPLWSFGKQRAVKLLGLELNPTTASHYPKTNIKLLMILSLQRYYNSFAFGKNLQRSGLTKEANFHKTLVETNIKTIL
jgi:hypothetical protein